VFDRALYPGLAVCILVAGGCATTPAAGERGEPSAPARGEAAGALEVLRLQEEAWNRGDLRGFMAWYHHSRDTSFSSATGTIRGWDTVLARYQERYPDRRSMGTLAFSEVEEVPLGERAALVTGRWRLLREGDTPSGVFSLVLWKFAEGWRIIHDHTSVDAGD
jgi:hypothetical protein